MAARRILTAIALAPALVLASPRSDPTTGRAVFTGAATPSATSLNLSPAAIGLGLTNEVYFAAAATLTQLAIDTRALDVSSGALSSGPKIRAADVAPGGDAAVLWHANDRLTLGGAIHVPPPEMQPEDRQALRYYTLGGSERTYMASVGVSLRVTNAFFVGASLAHENTYLHLTFARDRALDTGMIADGVGNPDTSELYDVRVRSPILSTSNIRVTLGTVVQVYPGIWLGIGYHTPPGFDIQTTLDGSMDVTRSPRDGSVLIHGDSTVYVSYPASIDGEIRAELPHDLELHVGGRWQDLSRMQAYDVRGYNSTFDANGIPEQQLRARGLHDAFALWAGVEQRAISERSPVQLGARIGYETASVDDARLSPFTIAPASITADVGAQLRLGRVVLQLSYGIAVSPTVAVDASDFDPRFRLECIDSNYDYTSRGCEAARNGYALPTAAGDYRRIEHSTRLGLRYEFY